MIFCGDVKLGALNKIHGVKFVLILLNHQVSHSTKLTYISDTSFVIFLLPDTHNFVI
jgi:hypothetical protein